MNVDKVAAKNFYIDNGDKIKQNWFLYEYSNCLFSALQKYPGLRSYIKRHSNDEIEEFCVYFSKRLRQSIHNVHSGKNRGVTINARYVYEFYPNSSHTQAQKMIEAAKKAWDEKLFTCSNCSNLCLADGFELTEMFDDLENDG